MRWLQCSYDDILSLPDGYLDVIAEVMKKEAQQARSRASAARTKGRRR